MRTRAENATRFSPKEELDGCRAFFLVGIGGAGMSGVAQMLLRRGFRVRGSDSTSSDTTDMLKAVGVDVYIGHSGDWISPDDVLVLTDAIDLDTSPEVLAGTEMGCLLFRRSQVLGWLLRGKKVIAVTGTHGKTTTTGMIGKGLLSAYLEPTVVVGAEVLEFGGAIYEGDGEWAVVEACEAYDSFHDLTPNVVVLTNLEADHLDYHGDYESLRDSAIRFIEKVPEDGALIYCQEDPGACEVASMVNVRTVPYNTTTFEERTRAVSTDGETISGLALIGPHNRLNAGGALAAATESQASVWLAATGIAQFKGAARRLQVLYDGAIGVVDDYAHHPTEVRASIMALRERFPKRRLIVVFQPHLYSRTAEFIKPFADALSLADLVVLTDIYPAREKPMPGISSARIANLITKPTVYIPNRFQLPRRVARLARDGDVVIGMGAGSISEFPGNFLKEIKRSESVRVAVIYAGDSAEREVSILSGQAVHDALARKGYEVQMVDMSSVLWTTGDLSIWTGQKRPDVAFLAVHGTHAEDGAIQGLFELMGVTYTGSDVRSSALAMDKSLAKRLLSEAGLTVPRGTLIDSVEWAKSRALPDIKPAVVVKPNAQGSTVGLSFVEAGESLENAIDMALRFGDEAIIEELVVGTEISVPVLCGEALPVVEIVPISGQYDFASKYLPGATEEIVPARISDEIMKRAQHDALVAHKALGCRGATRTDMIVRGDEIFVLEINTLPGMTATSLLPNSAKAAGIEFDDLCERILLEALNRDAKAR